MNLLVKCRHCVLLQLLKLMLKFFTQLTTNFLKETSMQLRHLLTASISNNANMKIYIVTGCVSKESNKIMLHKPKISILVAYISLISKTLRYINNRHNWL